MTRHKIAILVGSLRKDSINRKVARSICAFASDKLDCEIVEIGNCRSTARTMTRTCRGVGALPGEGRGGGRHPVLHPRI